MTPVQYCYWLQGFFEISENSECTEITLTQKQIQTIRAHLNLVFFHAIDPENLKGTSELDKIKYSKIHDGAKSGDNIEIPAVIQSIQAKDLIKKTPFDFDKFPKAYFEDSQIRYNC